MAETTQQKIEVMRAFEEGKKIECKSKGLDWKEWILPQEPAWNWAECDYRVKEEPKYRPYKNIEELFNDWAEKTHSIPANMEKYVRPLIWVKKECCGDYYEGLIILYYPNGQIKIGEQIFNLAELFYNFTFLDGSPCGKKE